MNSGRKELKSRYENGEKDFLRLVFHAHENIETSKEGNQYFKSITNVRLILCLLEHGETFSFLQQCLPKNTYDVSFRDSFSQPFP